MTSIFSVTSAASSLALLSVAELRALLGAGPSDDDLEVLGRRVALAIAGACGVAADGVNPPTLLRETCAETFRLARRVATLRLARRPVAAVTSVVENGTTLDPVSYELDPASGLVTRLSGDQPCWWPCGKVAFAFTAGYVAAPDDLKLAAAKLAAVLAAESGHDPNLKRESIPGVIEREWWVPPTTDPLITREIEELLSPYRQYWM